MLRLIDYHDRIVRRALADEGGREVKHTGDGIMSSFTFVSRAVSCATQIQREFARGQDAPLGQPRVRIGISAGEPVDQSDDIFGASGTWRRAFAVMPKEVRSWSPKRSRSCRSARASSSSTAARSP